MAKGWIKLHRQIMDNPIWLEKPFTKGQAWVDLILLANSSTSGSYKRGTVYKSQQWLAQRWGWSRGKVNRFLDKLQTDGMVTVKRTYNGTTSGTTVTLVKYGVFQDKRTPIETPNSTTNGANIKNIKEEDKSSPAKSGEQKSSCTILDDEDYLSPDELMKWYEEHKDDI